MYFSTSPGKPSSQLLPYLTCIPEGFWIFVSAPQPALLQSSPSLATKIALKHTATHAFTLLQPLAWLPHLHMHLSGFRVFSIQPSIACQPILLHCSQIPCLPLGLGRPFFYLGYHIPVDHKFLFQANASSSFQTLGV